MHRVLSIARCLALLVLSRTATACTCETVLSACREVATSQLVFIGTVESIDPISLSRWNLANRSSLQVLNKAIADAQNDPSPSTIARLKDTYLKMFSNLQKHEGVRLQEAKTASDVASLFSSVIDRGVRVRFKVKTLLKHEDDDKKGDKKPRPAAKLSPKTKTDDDDDEKEQSFDVWTPFDDCGFDFQLGETYLVFAKNDESSDYFLTDSCSRTRRLSEAGEDLSYLFFYKNDPKQSSRLEGFATTDLHGDVDFDQLHDPESIKSPVAGAVIELESKQLTRYAVSDKNGRFLYDGLPGDDYQISAFAPGYPVMQKMLAGPQSFHVEGKSCARQILLLQQRESR
jgi:hypothetical protein